MREIEIKARVADKNTLLERLKGQGVKLSDPVTHRDRVFGAVGVDGNDGDNTAPWLRIRAETHGNDTRHILTMKKSVTNQMDSIEHETEIANADEMDAIIEHIGFVPFSDLTKTRQKAKLGEVELCVDTVEGLGDFIEAERLTSEDADYEAVVAELWEILGQFGITHDSHVTEGYDVLMNKQLAG
jgi:adenylate cyclase class 2